MSALKTKTYLKKYDFILIISKYFCWKIKILNKFNLFACITKGEQYKLYQALLRLAYYVSYNTKF